MSVGGESWEAIGMEMEKRGGTQPGNLFMNRVAPHLLLILPPGPPCGTGERPRIGRLLYQPAAPTGKDGACGEILYCSGIKPTFFASASALEHWEGEGNGSLFVKAACL